METFENILIRVLMVSVDKHGSEKPVTLEHLLNIVRLAQSIAEGLHSSSDEAIHDALMQNVDPHDDKG